MAKLALLLIGLAAPAGAVEPMTAEMAMERYRERFEPIALLDCPKPIDGEEIVVCGRPGRPDPNRPPLPIPRTPGERIPGEPATMAVLNCLQSCPQPLKIDLIKAFKVGKKIVEHILDPD